MTDRPNVPPNGSNRPELGAERAPWIAADLDGPLTADETAELPLLAEVLADRSTWAEPSPGLADAVVAAVADAPAGASTAAATARAVDARPVVHRRRLVLAAAAAVVVVLALGGVIATRARSTSDYQGQLAATAIAPGASGSVAVVRNDAGFRITLDARGLPPLQQGEYYQAWLKSPTDTLVPIGTFSSSDGVVTLWSGVSPADYPTMSVTIEAPDNDQASSGRRVLVGPVQSA
jgi:hypothetical protein